MTTVYRLCSGRYPALDGEGARLYGGRYNHKGTAVVYCAGNLSLAVLETFVHLEPGLLPSDFVKIKVEIPDEVRVERLSTSDLPLDWRSIPGTDAPKTVGSGWAAKRSSVALAVPSAIIPEEDNYLLNPSHPDFMRLVVHPPEAFAFDSRMQKAIAPASPKRRKSHR